jgi:hypothetical protein
MQYRRAVLIVLAGLLSSRGLRAASVPQPHAVFAEVLDAGLAADIVSARPGELLPSAYRVLILDPEALEIALGSVPAESAFAAGRTAPILFIPKPEGAASEFAIFEAPTLDNDLAAQFPEIRTFRGRGITDPTETLILDVTPAGLHAMILSPAGTLMIDPLSPGDNVHHIVYRKQGAPQLGAPPPCRSLDAPGHEEPSGLTTPTPPTAPITAGESLRTYRTAIGVTGEYSIKVCSPSPAAVSCSLAAVVTVLNRVNGILERDLAGRMVLIANESSLIFTDPATDGYTNSDLNLMLMENQTKLDTVIGTANYDLGHVFGTAGGGTAYVGMACNATYKAQGATSLSNPVGDPFSVDYVAHEMGHQWGAHHSFNGTTGGCVFRDGNHSYEPASGSTLLSYAGLCGAEMLQPHHDDYYHAHSLDQMLSKLAGTGSACGTLTSTGNTPPTATTAPAFTIPMKTPFTLTGSASDANGDALTYAWEELDLGDPAPPNDDIAAVRPIFRSFPPSGLPWRTFPKPSDLLGNTTTLGESLPTRTRSMVFRFTVRDNRPGGGGLAFGSTTVSVTAAAGPFAVTAPNTAVTWPALSSQTVTWNVAGTTTAPVSCSTVSIAASTDGGNAFPLILLASTPNDGTQTVTVPNVSTTKARVRVACVGNIFFDVSNANFTISGGPAAGSFYTISPCRVLDTRLVGGPTGGLPIAANATLTHTVAGTCGVPASARSVFANVTALVPIATGDAKVYAVDNALPTATTISFTAGDIRANNAIFSLSQDGVGAVKIKNASTGDLHLAIDVAGYFE